MDEKLEELATYSISVVKQVSDGQVRVIFNYVPFILSQADVSRARSTSRYRSMARSVSRGRSMGRTSQVRRRIC